MSFGMQTIGLERLERKLSTLASQETAQDIAYAAVSKGIRVIRNAGVSASPGRVKLEWGTQVAKTGAGATAITGLGIGGYKSKVLRPHGHYLEYGTPYIPARYFAHTAFNEARPKALMVMKSVARARIRLIAEKTN